MCGLAGDNLAFAAPGGRRQKCIMHAVSMHEYGLKGSRYVLSSARQITSSAATSSVSATCVSSGSIAGTVRVLCAGKWPAHHSTYASINWELCKFTCGATWRS